MPRTTSYNNTEISITSQNSSNVITFTDNTQAQSSLQQSTGRSAVSPTVLNLSGFSTITTSQPFFSASMAGGTITIVNPVVNLQGTGTRGSNGLVYPSSQLNETTTTYTDTTRALSGSYTFAIISVTNSTKARVSQISGFKNDEDTLGSFYVLLSDASNVQYPINSFSATSNFTASYIEPLVTITTQNSASFADIILSNIEPATGDLYKVKTLYKPSGMFGEFTDLGDTIVEQTDVLIDENSLETNVTVGSFYENFGRFESLSEINTYWTSSGIGTLNVSTPLTLSYDMDVLAGGVKMTPASTNFTSNDATVFNIKPIYRKTLYANTEYIVTFNIANVSNISSYTNTNTNIPNPRLDVYISGSAVETQEAFRYRSKGSTQPVQDFNSTVNSSIFKDNGTLGTRIGTYQVTPISDIISSVTFRFKALETKEFDLKFVTRRGHFIIGDIQVLANQETGFSPNYVRIFKRIPSEHLNTPLTFKFQYFDTLGRKALVESVAYGAIFDGDNAYINGTNNLITGSVFIGNSIGSGVEMAGVNSAFIRSIGYQGYISASVAGKGGSPGFMIWSGSVLPGSGDNYNGVGIELVTDSDNYFRFRTNPSELDVHTEKFFLGSTGQYVSGSNGNIAISSSNFYLDASGNVTMQGTITATAGTIGGFAITSTAISSSNNSLILRGNTGEITGSNVLFTGGKIGGFTISNDTLSNASNFFISGAATGNQFFISSSRFNVKASGDVTASSALFSGSVSITGTVTATAGAIGGFVITQNALTGSGFFISGSPGNTGTGFFISSSRFNVKGNGDITGSQVLFTGGRIAGFTISNDTLSNASNFFLSGSATGNQFFISASNFNVKANGDVTASSALFSGSVSVTGNINARTGNIGGFNITTDAITGSGFFLSGSAANNGTSFFISSSRFNVKGNGDVTGSQVLFTGGRIGSFVLTNDALSGVRSDTGATSFFISSSVNTTSPDGVAFFISSSKFNVRQDGTISGSNVLFDGGKVGGFTIDSSKITGTNIIIDSAGSIQTSNYASDLAGWKISAVDNGFAEFENVKVRGTLKTAVFEKETVNAVGGQLYVANSTTITGSESTSLIPQLLYLKFGGYSGSNAIQNIAGSSNTYLSVDLTSASIQSLPVSAQTFKPYGSTALFIQSGSKTATSNANTGIASFHGITTAASASYTVMAWIRPDFSIYTTTTPTGSIIEKSGSAGTLPVGPFSIGFKITSVNTASVIYSTGNNVNVGGLVRSASIGDNALKTNEWTHIALSGYPFGANYRRILYVNGVAATAVDTATYANTNTSPITIGVGRSYTERFPGYIADVRLYTGSLTDSDIRIIYSGSYFTSSISSDTAALVVDNVTGFVNGEVLSAKKVSNTGFATEYLAVRDTVRINPNSDTDFSGILYVTRSYGNTISGDSSSLGNTPSNAQSYEPSQVIVSTGRIGTGFIRINANPSDDATPYIDIVERTGSGIYDIKLKARLGDLSGLANSNYVFGNSNPGFGLATDNVFLQGGIIANTGSIGGIRMQSNKLFTGTGTFNDNNTGFYLGSDSYFSLGNKLSWDTSTLAINGRITANEGKIGGFEITSNAITGSGFYLSGSADNNGTSFFISSSRFNIKGNGDITGSQVLFTGGQVGGFNITSTQLTASGFLLDSNIGEFELGTTSFTAGDGIYMSKATTNNFRVGDAGSTRLQFTGDNLEIYDSGNNRLVSLGTSNRIGGFTITSHSFAGNNFYISGSATGNQFFISASNFNVKANGNVTASNALFTGIATADIILDKTLVITAANSGSYLTTYDYDTVTAGTQNAYWLRLDGSLSGTAEQLRRVFINCNLLYPLGKITFPSVETDRKIDIVIETASTNEILDIFGPIKTSGTPAVVDFPAGSTITLTAVGTSPTATDWNCVGGSYQPFSGYTFKRGLTITGSTSTGKLVYSGSTAADFDIYGGADLRNFDGRLLASGSRALPAFANVDDTNTGIYFPAADTIGFVEGGAEAMRIDSSSNVIIAGTTANGKLTVAGSTNYYYAGTYGYLIDSAAPNQTSQYTGPAQTLNVAIYATDRILSPEFDAYSDERMKDVQGEIELSDALRLVNNLKPIKFTWKDSDDKGLKTGYSAQQASKAGFDHLIGLLPKEGLPEVTDSEGFFSPKDTQFVMNYEQVTPYYGVVIKHLLDKIEQLEKKIDELSSK